MENSNFFDDHNLFTRCANPRDATQIINYRNQVGGESDFLSYGKNQYPIDLKRQTAYLKSIQFSPFETILLGFIEEENQNLLVSVGNLSTKTSINAETHKLESVGEIGISVKRQYWHLGIGTQMLNRMLHFAQNNKASSNLKCIEIEVGSQNRPAIKLYEKCGFKFKQTTTKYFPLKKQSYNIDIMAYEIY